MYANYQQIVERAKQIGPLTVCVAAAQDADVLEAVKAAGELGIVKAILVGDGQKLRALAGEAGLAGARIVDEPDVGRAALRAAAIVHDGEAEILMKGMINSSDFLRAVLNKEKGLRTGRLLSHLSAFEIPGRDRLLFMTDGGMNIAPGLQEKKDILISSMQALNAMGIKPNVAVLTANEVVSSRMPATVDADQLAKIAAAGLLPPGVVEGPIALDVAISQAAARHKHIDSKVSGKVDLLLAPNIESGNLLGKALIYFGGAKMAGLVLGAARPIVMTSRSETPEGKLNSIALACLVYEGE